MNVNPYWYDAQWLQAYQRARSIVARAAPDRLEAFVAAFDVLRTDPAFTVRQLPGLIGPDLIESLRAEIRAIPRELLEMHEMRTFGRFIVHDHPAFTALQTAMVDRVSAWAGEAVEPFYNFLSLYTRMGKCDPHLDAPLAKWTLDLCIDQSHVWPIHFSQIVPWPEVGEGGVGPSDPALRYTPALLEPGDAVLFSGSSQWHYRDALLETAQEAAQKPGAPPARAFCDLLFFHYIPKGTLQLIDPNQWADLFDMPELALARPFDLGK
ncbi:MAG: hypothetical protein ABI673_08375 [Novosphingobium sp.]